jgi:glycosyltransferase involved in cell wall biosynthesis
VRVHVVDPSAYTPPYDRALCAALARAGVDVALFTSRFAHGEVPAAQGYAVHEFFYRRSRRRAAKLAQHVPDMLRYRRAARAAQLVHFQWLPVQQLDAWLLPRRMPVVLTAHDVLPHQPLPGQRAGQRRLYERVDAVIVHSARGRERLIAEAHVDPRKIAVIPHGVLEPDPGTQATLPPELDAADGRPVVLCFGLIRPYKGIDVLLEAWRGIEEAQLWIVGMPRMDIAPLRAAAPGNVRFVTRFVSEGELVACFTRADLAVLPYRRADQSGVLNTALAFGTPLLVSDVGGFEDVAELGAAELVAPGDAAALHDALRALLADEPARASLAAAARAAATGPLAWGSIAAQTLELYERLIVDQAL